MPDLIPGSGFEDLLSQVAVPDNNLISSAGFSQTVNPQSAFENAFRQSMQVAQDPRTPEFVSPFSVDPSKRFPLQVIGMDNEDIYAQGQGFWNKAVNATLKGLALAGTTVAQTTVGLVNGVFQAIGDGKFSSFYDNDFNRMLDGITTSLDREILPNYYSAAERNNPWYTNIFTANFFFDKIVKNLGFMAGAAISGNIYSSLLQAGKATATGNLLKTLQATEKAVLEGKTLDTLGSTASGLGRFSSGYNALNKGQRLLVSGLSTVGEAGIEAIQASNQSRERMINEFRVANGRDPEGAELKTINDAAGNIGNTVFALNSVILTASNYIQFPKLLQASNRAERGMYSELVKKANNVGFDAKTLSYIERGPKNRFVKLFTKAQPYGPSITEGLEEALQYAAQTGSENFWHKKYDSGEDMDLGFAEGATQLFSKGAVDDLIGKGLSEAFLTGEGQEQFFIGAVSGALGKGIGTARQQRERAAATKAFVDQSNRYKLSSYTKDLADSVKRGVPLAQNMEDSVRQGDVLEYKDAERDFLFNYLYPKIKHGRLDLFYDEINAYKQLAVTPEGFKQLQEEGKALPTDTREAYLVRLTNLERIAGAMQNAFTGINSRNAFVTKIGPDGKPMPKYSETVTNKMVYANSKIQDYDERILALSNSLGAAGVIASDVIENTDKFDEYVKIIDNLQTIGGRSVTDDQRVALKNELKDVVELSMRRKMFIGEYNDMLVNPQNWEDIPPRPTTAKPETVTIKTKDGDEEIEIGEQYMLGKVVKETEEGFLHEKYPTLTILAVNEDGSLKIKDGQGTIRTISPDELKGYKLSKVKDVAKNPKAVFYLKNKDKIWYYKFKGGKTAPGVLRWSYNKDQLYFEYKKNGKINRIPVRNSDFSYELARKKGFKNPIITTANATLTDIAEADELGTQEDKLNAKLAKRIGLITGFVTGSRNRVTEIEKLIQDKKKELKDTEEALDNLTKTKAGLPRKKYSKALTKTLQVLGDTRNKITREISNLEDERDELNAILPYYEDMLANARELPEDTLELVKELKEDIDTLEEIIDHTNEAIEQGGQLINQIDEALTRAYSLLNDYIKRVREENPNVPSTVEEFQERIEKYLGEEGARLFVEEGQGFVPLIKSIQADIAEFAEELEITPNETKIAALQAQIKELQQGLDQIVNEQLAKSKLLEFFEQKIKEERARQKEEAAILKNKELQSKIFASQREIDAYAGDINGDFDEATNQKELNQIQKGDETKLKPIEILASSTSDRSEDDVPDAQASASTIRARNFLFNQTHFPKEVKQNMKGLVVSINNEKSLGLDGLVYSIARQNTAQGWNNLSDEELYKIVTDPDQGVLLVVYAVEKDGEYIFLDENGKTVDAPTVDNVVASTLTSTSTNARRDGKSRVRAQDKDVAGEVMSQWRVKREAMINSDTPNVFDLSFSRGLPIYNEVDDKITTTKVEGSLVPASKMENVIDHQGAIKVITTDNYTHQDLPYKTIPGRVYFEYEDVFAPLSNRQFNKEEQETLYNVIYQLAVQAKNTGTLKGDYMNYLKNVLYWGDPKDGKAGRNQIWIDPFFGLTMGNKEFSIPFTPISLEQNKEMLMAYLSGTYNNINNNTLTKNFHDVFIEYYMENGELKTREHPTYQSFLFKNQMVETPIAPTTAVPSNGNRNFMQKYAILQGVEYTVTRKEEKKVVEKQPINEAIKEAKAAESVATEGEQLVGDVWEATSKKGYKIYFTATKDDTGKIEVVIDPNRGDYEKIEADLIADKRSPQEIEGAFARLAITEADKRFKAMEAKPKEVVKTVSAAEPEAKVSPTTISAPKDDNDVFRPVAKLNVERMTEEEKANFSKFMKEKLPQFTIREIEHMITMANGRQAWGRLQGNVITLYELAEKGTGYHEAFEAVWKYFVLPEEQEELMAEFKNRQGTFNDRVTNTTISYAEATDSQAKEELADEFARYKQGQKLTLGQRIRKFFDRIINFFRTFNRGYKPNTKLRDELFDRIEAGEFSQRKINKFSTDPEYASVRGLTEAQTHGFVQDLTKRVFVQLIREKIDIFELDNYARTDVYTKIREDYAETIAQFQNGEETFNDLWKRTKEYLATFNIEFDENNYVTVNDDNQTRNDYFDDKMKLDVKKSSPFAIKYLLASLAKVESVDTTGKIIYDKNGIVPNAYQLLPFGKTFITLLEALEGATSIDNMIGKLKSLSKSNAHFVPLLNMLGAKGGNIDWNNLTNSQWRTLSNLYNTFNKQRPNAFFITYNEETGEAYMHTADIGKAAESFKKQWESNVRFSAKTNKNLFVGYNKSTKSYGVNEPALKKVLANIGNTKVKLDFLNDLGIKFDLESYNKLNQGQRTSFANAVGSIAQYINKNKGLKAIKGKSLGISGPLTTLSELFARVNNYQSESTFINADGEQQQNYVQPNYFSQFADVFNQVYNRNELYQKLPHLKSDPYAQNSELLKLGGKFFKANGERTDLKLQLGYLDGFKKDQRGRKSADVDYNYRITNQINTSLEGMYEIGVPADSSTGWNLFMGEFIDFGKASSEALFKTATENIMAGYLTSEIALARDYKNHSNLSNVGEKANELRFFKDILSPINLKAANKMISGSGPIEITQGMKDDITKFINEEVKALRNTLEYNQEIVSNGKNGFEYRKLLDSFEERKNLNKMNLTESEVQAIIKYVVGNNIIANMEMHKIFFGDPYNYAIKDKNGKIILDETKRIKSFLSPAVASLVSDNYNNTFNKEFNTVGNTVLSQGIPGYYKVRNTINTVTFSDVLTQSQYVEHFDNNNEADAQAHHTLEMHRDLLNRHGQWSKKAEDWYRWEKAYERQQLFKKGVFTDYPEALRINDEGRLKKPKPEYTLHIIKPIVRGVKHNSTFLNPILDKFSSAPLVYSAVEGKNLEKLYIKMFKEDIDYVIFESGRKVGSEGKNKFYNGDGTMNNLPYRGKLTVNWKDYAVQVENSYDKGKQQVRGSQITKLFSLDFFSGGVPIDYEKDDWDTLSEDQKEAASSVYKEVKYNNQLLEEMTKHGYESLIQRLGLLDTGQNFIVEDYTKLYGTLERESLKRDMPENIKQIFRINPETNRPFLPLESTSEYTKIQKMLYSMVDNAVLSPKVNGGPKTQLSAFGWEDASQGRSIVMKKDGKYVKISREEYAALSDKEKEKVRLTSDTLKFYTKEDPRIEVLLPHWFKKQFTKAGFTTDIELLEYLNSTEEGQEILRGVGFRIPTTNMTAIEAIRVKGFLPQEYGDTIVVPTEITTKAGSDFDIDKLSTYLKNIFIDSKNRIRLVPFFGFGEEAKKKLNEIATKIAVAKEDRAINALEDFEFTEEDEDEYLEDVERLYKQSLENEYFRSLERMITHPKNFDRLVEPTENPTLSQLAGEISELTNRVESNKLTRLLSIDYLSKLRHAFLAGKKWVGIGAVNNTGHSQSQRSNQYIDVINTDLNQRDREILQDSSIALPHNIDKEGRPSLSGIYDQTKKFISSKLGWYLTSFVDIAKDPYILNIIHSRKLVGAFLFLERLGVPTNTIGYFMNQPIVREYVHFTDIAEVNRIASHYYRDKFLDGNLEFKGTTDTDIKVDNATLKANIKAYYVNKKTDQAWRNQQRAILDEFIKYLKMSEHVFMATKATNWDTARFATGASVRQKELLLKKQREQNIIKSPDNILDYSNNGKIREAMLLAKDAIDSLSIVTSPDIRGPLNKVLDRYLNLSYISDQNVEKIDSQLLNSFIDYLVQTKRALNGKTIEYLVADVSTSIVARVQAIREGSFSNPIFSSLRTAVSNRVNDADNIKLAPFPKDVYDKNLISGYLQELRESDSNADGSIKPNSIYGDLVKLALLQGTGSQANLLSYIPIQDTSAILQSVIGPVTKADAENFAANFNFERSQWRNTDIVLPLQKIYPKYKFNTKFKNKVLKLSDVFDNKNGITERPLITLNRYHQQSKGANRYDVTTGNTVYLSQIQTMIKNSDYSFTDKVGYQKVYIPGTETPLTVKETTDQGVEHTIYFYKQVNLTGSNGIQEHYTTGQKSVLENGTVKVDPLSDQEIVNEILGINKPQAPAKPSFEQFKNGLKRKDCK